MSNDPTITLQIQEQSKSRNWVVRHWRGELKLWVSFWVVGVGLVLVASLLTAMVPSSIAKVENFEPILIFGVLVFGWPVVSLVQLWFLVGVWRSATNHDRRLHDAGKSTSWGLLAKLVVLGNLVSLISVLHTTAIPQTLAMYKIAFLNDPEIPSYSILLTHDGRVLEVRGGFKYGLAKAASTVIRASPGIELIYLHSQGGRIAEAVALYRVIRANKLSTYVDRECSSACTLAFAGGVRRLMIVGARLCFHSASFPGIAIDEQPMLNSLQVQIMTEAGFPSEFVRRAVSTPPQSKWCPTDAELVDAGVVTEFSKIQIDQNSPEALGLVPWE